MGHLARCLRISFTPTTSIGMPARSPAKVEANGSRSRKKNDPTSKPLLYAVHAGQTHHG